jgi:hypothetical protein
MSCLTWYIASEVLMDAEGQGHCVHNRLLSEFEVKQTHIGVGLYSSHLAAPLTGLSIAFCPP